MFRTLFAQALYWWAITHRYIGVEHNVTREFERAAYYFGRAYAIDPTFYQARLNRTIMLGREFGRIDEALAELDEILTADEAYTAARLNRAQFRQEAGDYHGALADWQIYLEAPDANHQDLAQHTIDHLHALLDTSSDH